VLDGRDFRCRVAIGSEQKNESAGETEADGKTDDRRSIRAGAGERQAHEEGAEAGAQHEDGEEIAVDLAERAHAEIARKQKGDEIDFRT
jgi:hypothetical protein